MGRLLVCAARFLASAAFCRYSSDRDDMQGEHWKDASVPQIHRTRRQVRRWAVGHDRPPRPLWQAPARRLTPAGRGAWMIPLTRTVGVSTDREPVRDAS